MPPVTPIPTSPVTISGWRSHDGTALPNELLPLPQAMTYVLEGQARGQQAGAQLYVSLHGHTLVDAACGEARPGVSMTSDSVVPWLSAGKPLLSMALGRLWEKGALEIDDPVVLYVPEFAPYGKE